MDESLFAFNIVGNMIADNKENKTRVKITDHEKIRSAVVLSCLADGTRLESMVILERKKMTKI